MKYFQRGRIAKLSNGNPLEYELTPSDDDPPFTTQVHPVVTKALVPTQIRRPWIQFGSGSQF